MVACRTPWSSFSGSGGSRIADAAEFEDRPRRRGKGGTKEESNHFFPCFFFAPFFCLAVWMTHQPWDTSKKYSHNNKQLQNNNANTKNENNEKRNKQT